MTRATYVAVIRRGDVVVYRYACERHRDKLPANRRPLKPMEGKPPHCEFCM